MISFSFAGVENELNKQMSPQKLRILKLIALIFYGQATSICCCIRYGFLADAFLSRGISGTIYGMIEGSLIIGFAFIYLCGGFEKLLTWKRVNSRCLLMFITGGYAVTSFCTGLVYLSQDNNVVVIVSTVLRILQGVITYGCPLVAVDFINAQHPTEFDFVNGLLNMGYFSGMGMAEVFGCLLYDSYGYLYPFLFSSTIALLSTFLIAIAIPKSATYLASQEETDLVNPSTRLSKAIILPLIACMIINLNFGVLQVSVTPFLQEVFHKSISYGGIVLIFVSIGMTLSSLVTGMLLQKKVFHHFTIMAFGASCLCLGFVITFPPDQIPIIFNKAPILAIPGVFLSGFGAPMITIATLRALYDMQLQRIGILTPRCVTSLTGIWLVGYSGVFYSGSFLAGVLTDHLTFSDMAEILSAFCLVSALLCVALRVLMKGKDVDEEIQPLLP